MPYTKMPEELSFVKHFDGSALQRLIAQKAIVIERATGHTATASQGPWYRRRKVLRLHFVLRLKLRNVSVEPVRVTLARGTFWHAAHEWHQPLLLVRDTQVVLQPKGKASLALDCFGGASLYYCPPAGGGAHGCQIVRRHSSVRIERPMQFVHVCGAAP